MLRVCGVAVGARRRVRVARERAADARREPRISERALRAARAVFTRGRRAGGGGGGGARASARARGAAASRRAGAVAGRAERRRRVRARRGGDAVRSQEGRLGAEDAPRVVALSSRRGRRRRRGADRARGCREALALLRGRDRGVRALDVRGDRVLPGRDGSVAVRRRGDGDGGGAANISPRPRRRAAGFASASVRTLPRLGAEGDGGGRERRRRRRRRRRRELPVHPREDLARPAAQHGPAREDEHARASSPRRRVLEQHGQRLDVVILALPRAFAFAAPASR